MKKCIAFILAMIISVLFAGCNKPDIEECVAMANTAVRSCDQYIDDSYGFFAEFSEEEMIYTVVTYVDEEEVARIVAGIETDYPNALRVYTISALDEDEELITGYLSILRIAAEEAFEGTKVTVVTCHMNTDGEIKIYD